MTAVAVFGLENLQNKQLQVDQEANLLEGITFAEGLTLQKVEVETGGVTLELAAPHTYTPDYPDLINLVLTIAKPDGNTIKERVDAITVKPLDYQAPSLSIVDFINEKYTWYNNLNQITKDFIYPHLAISFEACN